MTLRTGSSFVSQTASKRVSGLNPLTGSPAHPFTKNGFTLLEVILSAAIITAGFVFILQAIGRQINAVSIADDKIQTALFLKEKISQTEAELLKKGKIIPGLRKGDVIKNGKTYKWTLSINEDEQFKNLHEIKAVCSWQKFGRQKSSALASRLYIPKKDKNAQ